MQRADSLEKTLMMGKIEGKGEEGGRGWDACVDSFTDSMDMNLGELQEMVRGREAWRAAVYRFTKSGTWLSDWTTATLGLTLKYS